MPSALKIRTCAVSRYAVLMFYPAFFGPKSFGRNALSVAKQLQDRLILAQKSWLPSGRIVCYQLHYSRFIVGMCRLMNHRWVAAALVTAMLSFPVRAAYAVDKDLPQLDHVVVVIFENHSFDQIVDPNHAPFIYSLAVGGALFVNAFAVSHPSQPNYFALFSGSAQGVRDDEDHRIDAPNLASALDAARRSFIGYVETGSPRKHNPWESFVNARAMEQSLSEFPSNFAQLPTVSFVIPALENDMHDGSVRDGDTWLKVHLGAYAEWAKMHNSLLIVTFDEDDYGAENHIPTVFYGARVRPGQYAERISHYNVLSTLLAMYALPPFAEATTAPPIRIIWD